MNNTSQLVINVDLDDLVKGFVSLEAKGLGSLGVEMKLPIANDGVDKVVLLHLDKSGDFLARDLLEGVNHFSNANCEGRHSNSPTILQFIGRETCRMKEVFDCLAGTGHGMFDRPFHRADSLDASEGFANDTREEGACGFVGLPGPDTNGGKAQRNAVDESFARVIIQINFTNGFLGTITGPRSTMERIGDAFGNRRTKDSSTAGQDEPRSVRFIGIDSIQQELESVNVDGVAKLKVLLGIARYDGSQMEDKIRLGLDGGLHFIFLAEIGRDGFRRDVGGYFGKRCRDDIDESQLGNCRSSDRPFVCNFFWRASAREIQLRR